MVRTEMFNYWSEGKLIWDFFKVFLVAPSIRIKVPVKQPLTDTAH